jgi:hypothetical protein
MTVNEKREGLSKGLELVICEGPSPAFLRSRVAFATGD